jgi:hypothetical protein
VQDRTVLGDVDPVAPEHRVPSRLQGDLVRERQQGREDVVVEQSLGEVDEEVAGGEAESLYPCRIAGEPGPQIGGEPLGDLGQP